MTNLSQTVRRRKDASSVQVESSEMIWREERGLSVKAKKVYWRESRRKAARKDITMAEVAMHCTRDDVWICVEGRAYDISRYVEHHPGGWLPIASLAGKEVTDAFASYHPASVYEKLLPSYYIGDIIDYKVSAFVQEHRQLTQQLYEEGKFETNLNFYALNLSWCFSLLGLALYLTMTGKSFAVRMLGAFFLAFHWQQIAFFGHDIGHNGITHNREFDQTVGVVMGNIISGISMGWWKRSHNVHHVVCNSVECDPDNQHLPIFAVDKEYFGGYFSTYHERQFVMDRFARALVSIQHIIYYPVMMLARYNLCLQGILLLLSKEKVPLRKAEVISLGLHWCWFLTVVIKSMESWQEVFAYIIFTYALAGLLNVQITLSHFGEEVYHGNDESHEWFRMQVRTTLNIDCPWWMDWFHGGLQFQVEHHLWPRLPRHNLRYARSLVKVLCKKHDIKYNELGFFQAQLHMLKKLKKTAMEVRSLTKGDGGFSNSGLYEGLNAIG